MAEQLCDLSGSTVLNPNRLRLPYSMDAKPRQMNTFSQRNAATD